MVEARLLLRQFVCWIRAQNEVSAKALAFLDGVVNAFVLTNRVAVMDICCVSGAAFFSHCEVR